MPSGSQFSRRLLVGGVGATWLGCATASPPASTSSPHRAARSVPPARPPVATSTRAQEQLAELERRSGARLGVAVLDTGSGSQIAHRGDERFPMCSTFKLPLAAAVLKRVDEGREVLSRRVAYEQAAVLEYAPVTAQHVTDGMSIEALCEASVTVSDNTAANLLLDTVGGPAGLTAFFRRLGDGVSRLDRNEPWLNTAIVGDERDTTTPRAMLGSMRELLLGPVLSASSRQRLIDWLIASTTGLTRLRAGLPASHRAGDKTGTGENGATNDVCITWPPNGAPVLIAAYSRGSEASTLEERSALLADVARIVITP